MSAGARFGGAIGLAPATTIMHADDQAVRLAPVRINLLPHRDAARERRKKDFVALGGLVFLAAIAVVMLGGVVIGQQISSQKARNEFIQAENLKLDKEIAEIKTLRDEIRALKARQQAVENLQSDRTAPVRLLDELVRITPEGVTLRQVKHDDQRVTLSGQALSNERVAEFLRNLSEGSPLLERPELGEIREITGQLPGSRDNRRLYDFSLNVLMKRIQPELVAPKADAVAAATGR